MRSERLWKIESVHNAETAPSWEAAFISWDKMLSLDWWKEISSVRMLKEECNSRMFAYQDPRALIKILTHMLLASLPITKMCVEWIHETWRDFFLRLRVKEGTSLRGREIVVVLKRNEISPSIRRWLLLISWINYSWRAFILLPCKKNLSAGKLFSSYTKAQTFNVLLFAMDEPLLWMMKLFREDGEARCSLE